MKDLKEVADKVKDVEDGVSNLILPLLKDTISDNAVYNKRLYNIIKLLLAILVIVAIISIATVYKQNEKYAEFLSQFEFESEVIQDFDTSDSSAIYNPIINN